VLYAVYWKLHDLIPESFGASSFGAMGAILHPCLCLLLLAAGTIDENGPSALSTFAGSSTPFVIRNALDVSDWKIDTVLDALGSVRVTVGPADEIVYLDGTAGEQVALRDYVQGTGRQRHVVFDSSLVGARLLETLQHPSSSASALSNFSAAFNRSSAPRPSELLHNADDVFVSHVASIGAGRF
jgi:hypothetical protein